MRIGNDLILFTKRDGKSSMLMLSRTFHDKEQIESIICPMPAWDTATSEPIYQTGGVERVSFSFTSIFIINIFVYFTA